jgi:hypothetical protein
MLLFRSEEHVRHWYDRRGIPLGATLTLQQQWDLARIWYRDRMSPDWRRRSPTEAQAVFAAVGLSGAFWRLTAPG